MYGPVALPSLEVLRAVFRYDPETGSLNFYRRGEWRLLQPTPGTRYITAMFAGRRLYAHRIAWKLHYRSEPPAIIDHIDRDKSNNKIANLRSATAAENNANKVPVGDLPRGVFFDRKRGWYRARIRIDGRSRWLGYFKTADAAGAAYEAAARLIPSKSSCTQEV